MLVNIEWVRWLSHGSMTIDLKELLYPDPWSVYDDKRDRMVTVKDHGIRKVKKIFTLIHTYADGDTWEDVRVYIEEHKIRRYKKYLEIWRAIDEM